MKLLVHVLLVAAASALSRRQLITKAPAAAARDHPARRNAERYRVKAGICTPTNPADCSERFGKMLDPRKGLSKEELAVRDKRNDEELNSLKGMMAAYDPDVARDNARKPSRK